MAHRSLLFWQLRQCEVLRLVGWGTPRQHPRMPARSLLLWLLIMCMFGVLLQCLGPSPHSVWKILPIPTPFGRYCDRASPQHVSLVPFFQGLFPSHAWSLPLLLAQRPSSRSPRASQVLRAACCEQGGGWAGGRAPPALPAGGGCCEEEVSQLISNLISQGIVMCLAWRLL